MTVEDRLKIIANRYKAGVVDRPTAILQVRTLLNESDPFEALLQLAIDILTKTIDHASVTRSVTSLQEMNTKLTRDNHELQNELTIAQRKLARLKRFFDGVEPEIE